MKVNLHKCHFTTSSGDEVTIYGGSYNIKNNKCEKLLGIKIYNKLNFDNNIGKVSKKAVQKINALSRVTPYVDLPKRRVLLNVFFLSQFSYCPLVWMFDRRCKYIIR